MDKMVLEHNWQMQVVGENIYGIPEEWRKARIPGSVYGNLLEQGLMPDPYDRMNELEALRLMENDFRFRTTFCLSEEQVGSDFVLLRFAGIDTLADIYLNDVLLGQADNMHRIWEFDIAGAARVGENTLRVELHSPTKYIAQQNEKVYAGGSGEAMKGFPHLRKAHCMFGWDWGPRLPDMGIFREVSVLSGRMARIEEVYITQDWLRGNAVDITPSGVDIHTGMVDIKYSVTIENFVEEENYEIRTALYDELGALIGSKSSKDCPDEEAQETGAAGWDTITVQEPKRWWPHGYGEQPLYRVEVTLADEAGTVLDVWSRRIGLRTMTVNTNQDEWGECFAHEVNGVKIFAMGADYIPEDNILSRVTRQSTERLLKDAVAANHNCVRVWGGGYYPDDWFFDLCDELGLIVWQDFMFACAAYELNDEFERNIAAEIRDNVRRIRHHACLALWCGNNEVESEILGQAWKPSIKQKYDYIKIFEYIIPKILQEEDPVTFYWPSSPSSGGNFDNPYDESRGDTHYWDV